MKILGMMTQSYHDHCFENGLLVVFDQSFHCCFSYSIFPSKGGKFLGSHVIKRVAVLAYCPSSFKLEGPETPSPDTWGDASEEVLSIILL